MSWTAPRTWIAGETVTAALLNTHLRDNLLATAPAIVTTAGDIVYATAANALTRLGIGAANKVLVSTGSAPAWSDIITNLAAKGTTSLGALPTAGEGNFMLGGRIANNSTPNNGVDLGGSSTADNGVISVTKTNGALQFVYYNGAAYVEQMRLSALNVFVGDTANANATQGLTINQGAADDEILALKSSDVAHGVTTHTETDTYSLFKKTTYGSGGLVIWGLNGSAAADYSPNGTSAIEMYAIANGATTTTKSNAAGGLIKLSCGEKSGTSYAAATANSNLFVVASGSSTVRFILDADGDSHQDVGTAWTNFDDHDDLVLLTALAVNVARKNDPIRDNFRGWLRGHRRELEIAKLVTFNRNGHHFVNMSRLTMLLTGAVRQLGAQLQIQTERLAMLEAKLLPGG